MWTGMAPVYAKAVLLAIVSGPNRKPTYVVTRKHDDLRWHWWHTLPQTMVVLTVFCTAVYAARFRTFPNLALLAATVYWGGLNIALLTSFISRSWYGIKRAKLAAHRLTRGARGMQLSETLAHPPG